METWSVQEGDVVEVIGALSSEGLKMVGTLKEIGEEAISLETDDNSIVTVRTKDIVLLKKRCLRPPQSET